MTLQVINSTTAGATQDLSARVFMASERLGLPPFSIMQRAEEGSVAHSTLVVDDPSGNLTLKGHRRIYFVETSAPAGEQVIGNTYIGTKTIDRGDWVVGPLARTYSVQLADTNTLIGRRLMVGEDANRPAETDVQRVQWLQTTTEANEFNASSTYINTDGAVDMDAVDYRQQSVEAILNDCSQASHKNYWVIYEEALGEFSLWYDWDHSPTYDSTILLSNDEADIDDSTTFAYFPTSNLTQDPSRVYSGTLVPFQPANTETTSWVYETQLSTGNEFVFRDVSYPSINVKTEAKARARAILYNTDSASEEDVFHVSFVVPSAKVNALMHGHRVQIKGTHWGFSGGNSYTTYTWTRCLTRTVTQLAPTHYRIDAELTPVPVETPTAVLWRAQTDNRGGGSIGGIFPIGWRCSGDLDESPSDPGCSGHTAEPTVGPLHPTHGKLAPAFDFATNYLGYTFEGSGTIDGFANFQVFGALNGVLQTAEILIDGVVVASDTCVSAGAGGCALSITFSDIAVSAGSLLTGQYYHDGAGAFYLDTPGGDLDLSACRITGGTLFSG